MFKKLRVGFLITLFLTILFFLVLAHPAEGEKVKQLEAIEMPIYYTVEQEPSKIIETKPKPPSLSISLSEIQEYAKSKVGEEQWPCLYKLVLIESGWNPNAQNKTSTAYGLGQFLNSTWAGTGYEKTANPYIQLDAMFIYIEQRYMDSCSALNFQLSHNWY